MNQIESLFWLAADPCPASGQHPSIIQLFFLMAHRGPTKEELIDFTYRASAWSPVHFVSAIHWLSFLCFHFISTNHSNQFKLLSLNSLTFFNCWKRIDGLFVCLSFHCGALAGGPAINPQFKKNNKPSHLSQRPAFNPTFLLKRNDWITAWGRPAGGVCLSICFTNFIPNFTFIRASRRADFSLWSWVEELNWRNGLWLPPTQQTNSTLNWSIEKKDKKADSWLLSSPGQRTIDEQGSGMKINKINLNGLLPR